MPQGKLMKAVKRLKKLWPPKTTRKKKRLSSDWYDEHHRHCLLLPQPQPQPPPSLPYRRYSCPYPSAPPLPEDQIQYFVEEPSFPDESSSATAEFDHVASYQHYYMAPDPDPAYGVPILPAVDRRETLRSSGGFFGCLAMFGINVIRCFCPCFHIRDIEMSKPKRSICA